MLILCIHACWGHLMDRSTESRLSAECPRAKNYDITLPVGNDWKRKRKSEKLEKLTTSGSVVNRLHVAWLQNHRLVFEIPINKSFPKRREWDDNWGVCLKGFLTENNGEDLFFFLLEIMDCKVVKLTLNSDYHGDTV